jgi:hypothetical protein
MRGLYLMYSSMLCCELSLIELLRCENEVAFLGLVGNPSQACRQGYVSILLIEDNTTFLIC